MNYPKKSATLTLIWCVLSVGCYSADSKKERDSEVKATPISSVGGENLNAAVSQTNSAAENNMNDKRRNPVRGGGGFQANLPPDFKSPTDAVGQRILKEYGALFLARNGAIPPNTAIFKSAAEVSDFQNRLSKSVVKIGGFDVELQSAAIKNLQEAISEAQQANLRITPRGADSARRDYAGTVELWASRVNPGLAHYVAQGKIPQTEADRVKSLPPFEQVPEIFKLESQGMFFSKDLSKSIVYSVAPPGTSQHLSMLALDVAEYQTPRVREILAAHGWFQTVVSDLPHFTFLGVPENELTNLGLKKADDNGQTFYIPNL